ncbi:MAG TPA: NusG domain II-containing protein [Acholeplasma sp.]|nr:NusG domain II-containing protein [Acholeplasma sp.]
MKTKNKNDLLLIGLALILLGGLLIYAVSTRIKGQFAYIKVSNQVVLNINLNDGTYQMMKPVYLIEIDAKPSIDGQTLKYNNEVISFEFGQTVVVYENYFYLLGGLGIVEIEYKDNKVRVSKEKSPYNICSKQGFSDIAPIVCLPNFVTIEFTNDTDVIIG